jgi:geranylgeranyl pyrophosphate synthase
MLAILEGGTHGRLSALRPFLERHEAIRYAREKADGYADRARRQLDSLAPSLAVEAMRLLTQFVVARPA